MTLTPVAAPAGSRLPDCGQLERVYHVCHFGVESIPLCFLGEAPALDRPPRQSCVFLCSALGASGISIIVYYRAPISKRKCKVGGAERGFTDSGVNTRLPEVETGKGAAPGLTNHNHCQALQSCRSHSDWIVVLKGSTSLLSGQVIEVRPSLSVFHLRPVTGKTLLP